MNHGIKLLFLLGLMVLPGADAVAQDARLGREVFNNQCQACHSVDGTNGVGPSLKGVFGREAGSAPGFRYSKAMVAATLSWDAKSLDSFVSAPQKVVPGNMMPFAGIDDAAQRAALMAYLIDLK